jgi:nucleolar protein 14
MPPSQLKRLKLSLRENGIVGPQKSKKQKKQANKDEYFKEGRIQRNSALQHIREQFNPFEIKAPARNKYEFTNSKTVGGRVTKGVLGRPGVTKGLGEEKVWLLQSDVITTRISLLIVYGSAEKHC